MMLVQSDCLSDNFRKPTGPTEAEQGRAVTLAKIGNLSNVNNKRFGVIWSRHVCTSFARHKHEHVMKFRWSVQS